MNNLTQNTTESINPQNIWATFNFTETLEDSVYDVLKPQMEFLSQQTHRLLTATIDMGLLSNVDDSPIINYRLRVTNPTLGNYGETLMTITEWSEKGKFPVDIYVDCDPTAATYKNITKELLFDTIGEILKRPFVEHRIMRLYRNAKEVLNNK